MFNRDQLPRNLDPWNATCARIYENATNAAIKMLGSRRREEAPSDVKLRTSTTLPSAGPHEITLSNPDCQELFFAQVLLAQDNPAESASDLSSVAGARVRTSYNPGCSHLNEIKC
jgi:hypothetical protein